MYDRILKNLPSTMDLIFRGDERIETYREDTMMRGDPDAVLRARDEKEAAEALIFCNKNGVPVTLCASQTSMTGSSVATEGLLISTEKLEGVIDIGIQGGVPMAAVRAGTVTSDMQNAVSEAGYFFPVAPTSRDECRIGANVSTNVTGEDSFKYGPIRPYVQKIKVFLPDGSQKLFERTKGEKPSGEHNRAGYFTDWKNPIDLFIGSEGTLGFISEVTVKLLPKSPEFFSALVPFPSNMKALECLADMVKKKPPSLRALEYIDRGALAAMMTAEKAPRFPEGTKALLYFKEEFKDEKEKDALLERWYIQTASFAPQKFADGVIIAETHKQKEAFRLWRHRIPEWANEEGRKHWAEGGGKVGSDWWVPAPRLLEMMNFFYTEAEELKLPYMAYAHLGRGHPHTNAIARTPQEKKKAEEMLLRCCRKAVELGGGVSGEHGIGKIHTDLMPIQHSSETINKMKEWKKNYDPKWILGRGNLFNY
jgi:FAD/FMN-containing dehydrogenase